MSIRNKPNYGIYPILLTVAGSQDLPIEGSRIAMISALSGLTPTAAVVSVLIGKSLGDAIPFTTGTEGVVTNKFDFIRLTWTAQPGIIATFIISDDADGNGIHVTAPPTVTAGNLTITQGGNSALVNASGELVVAVRNDAAGANVVNPTGVNALVVGQVAGGNGGILANPAMNTLPLSSAGGQPQVQPGGIGGSFFNATPAINATTIVAAGSNTHGVVVRTAEIYASGAGDASLVAGAAVPTGATTNPAFLRAVAAGALAILPREILLPAGQGLYVWSAAGTAQLNVTYDIL